MLSVPQRYYHYYFYKYINSERDEKHLFVLIVFLQNTPLQFGKHLTFPTRHLL